VEISKRIGIANWWKTSDSGAVCVFHGVGVYCLPSTVGNYLSLLPRAWLSACTTASDRLLQQSRKLSQSLNHANQAFHRASRKRTMTAWLANFGVSHESRNGRHIAHPVSKGPAQSRALRAATLTVRHQPYKSTAVRYTNMLTTPCFSISISHALNPSSMGGVERTKQSTPVVNSLLYTKKINLLRIY
jgi:hypothetical protein